MEYKRIDENTIRCIITPQDMEEYGLDLDEFLSHSEKSDDFLRHIVAEARDELGYQNTHGMVSMRLEVLNDGRICLTFAGGDEEKIRKQMIKHMQQIFPDLTAETLDKAMHQLGEMTEEKRNEKLSEIMSQIEEKMKENHNDLLKKSKQITDDKKQQPSSGTQKGIDEIRIFEFPTLSDVLEYARAIRLNQPIRSHLYKADDLFYLVVEKYRISNQKFQSLTALAYDYSYVYADITNVQRHLAEHGELLIENQAIGKLKRV